MLPPAVSLLPRPSSCKPLTLQAPSSSSVLVGQALGGGSQCGGLGGQHEDKEPRPPPPPPLPAVLSEGRRTQATLSTPSSEAPRRRHNPNSKPAPRLQVDVAGTLRKPLFWGPWATLAPGENFSSAWKSRYHGAWVNREQQAPQGTEGKEQVGGAGPGRLEGAWSSPRSSGAPQPACRAK